MSLLVSRRFGLMAAAAIMTLGLPLAASAQADYPTKPVKFIVPFPPGGTSDVMARMVSDELGKVLKQPILVENVGGAGGVIGTERGVRAPADGYTLIMTGVGQNAVAHGLDPNIKYDTNADFIHITQIHSGPNVLVTHPNAPFKTLAEMIDYARKNPGKLDYGFTHAASGHMAMELLRQTVCAAPGAKPPCQSLPMVGIPYRGGGPMMTAILGGEIPVMFINQDVALPHVKAGKLKPVAVSSRARNALYPEVPTVAESGYPGFEALSWSGLSVPKGTPRTVVERLEAAMAQVMASPAVVQRMSSTGFVIPAQGSKAYTEFVRNERERWIQVIKSAGIKPE